MGLGQSNLYTRLSQPHFQTSPCSTFSAQSSGLSTAATASRHRWRRSTVCERRTLSQAFFYTEIPGFGDLELELHGLKDKA